MDFFILLLAQFTLIAIATVAILFVAITLLSGKSLRDELGRIIIGERRDEIEQRRRMQLMKALATPQTQPQQR